MPCRDDWGPERHIEEQVKKADRLAAMLCQACTAMEAAKVRFPEDVAVWWEAHKQADKARQLKEAAERRRNEVRRSALEKLTAEERAVLGIPLNG